MQNQNIWLHQLLSTRNVGANLNLAKYASVLIYKLFMHITIFILLYTIREIVYICENSMSLKH